MAEIITIANLKGGTGKTNVAINLGMFLSALGKRVLLVDLSPLGDAAFCLGIKTREIKAKNKIAIKSTPYFGYDVMPCFRERNDVIKKLKKDKNSEIWFKGMIKKIQEDYDFIIIDTAPSLDSLLHSALFCSNRLIIPLQCEYLALRAAKEFIYQINSFRKLSIKKPEILLTMYMWRSRLSRNISKLAKKEFKDQVLNATIPKSAILAEEVERKEPVLKSFPNSRAARAFRQLAEEIIENSSKIKE